jgi:hypothetical protein
MKPHDPVSIARPSTRFIPVLASSVPPLGRPQHRRMKHKNEAEHCAQPGYLILS